MSTTVRITSNNFSGQTGDLTFYPDTGGTVNVGSVVIPYDYTADYVYGQYDVYFSAYTLTCNVTLPNNYLLQEDGFYLLQEDGSKIIIT